MNSPPTEIDSDPLGLVDSAADDRPIVSFGDVDVSSAMVGGRMNSQINSMASAILELDAEAAILADVDFSSEVIVARGHRDAGRMFTGYAVESHLDAHVVKVKCESSPTLHDPMSGSLTSKTFPVDNIHSLLREAGMAEERLRLAGLDGLPTEIFEAVSPINGLLVSGRVAFGEVIFLPSGSVSHVTRFIEGDESPFLESFQKASTYAVTYVTSARSYDAETAAIARFELAVAWANVRLRFSNALSPSGTLIPWHRSRLKQLASRSNLIAMRGLTTNRSRLHHMAPPSMTQLDLTADGTGTTGVMAVDSGLRGAVKAAARAISSADPLTRVTAISECLEFYVGSTEASYGFTKSERKAILRVAKEFEVEKKTRVDQLVSSLNDAPLMRRLRFQLAVDGVPITDGEMDTLLRVRAQRNEVVHGRTDVVNQADIDQAVALLARILVYASGHRLPRQEMEP